MIQIEYLPIVLTGIGIIISILYYASALNNQRKNRMKELVFQRMQARADLEYQKMVREINQMRFGWNTVEEFHEKYNFVTTPDLIAKRGSVIARLESWGFLLREGLIDETFIDRLHVPFMIIRIWESYEPIFMSEREEYGNPEAFKDLEFLYRVVKRKYPNISADTKFSWDIAQDIAMEHRTSESSTTQ